VLQTASIRDAVDEFNDRGYGKWTAPGGAGVIIYGDATGAHGDTRSKQSDYDLLRRFGFTARRSAGESALRHRHNSVNGRLRNALGEISIKIHPRCKTLVRGLELLGYKENSVLEEEIEEQHVTAAFSYLVEHEWPFIKYEDATEPRRWK